MDTKLTVNQIEYAISRDSRFDFRKNDIVCNVSWGMLDHEADMLIMSKSGYLTEIEIKRSLSDLAADFKKGHDHSHALIKYFYYAVPVNLVERCQEFISKCKRTPLVSGIIGYHEDGSFDFYPCDPDFTQRKHLAIGGRKLFLEERLQLLRLGCMRVWKLKQKLAEKENGNAGTM